MSTPSNVSPISAAVASAREAARHGDGQFGTQVRAEAGDIDLMPADSGDQFVVDNAAAVVAVMEDVSFGHTTLYDYPEQLAERLPAIAETVRNDRTFAEEHLFPLNNARYREDWDEVVVRARRIAELNNAEQAYLDQDWRPAGVQTTAKDGMYGDTYTGDLYEQSRPLTEVAKDMRADIKAAQAAGYIPDDLNYRVVKDGNSLRIIVEGMPDERSLFRDHHSPYAHGREFVARPSWEANRLTDRLKQIGHAYARQQGNAMADYRNDSHYVFVEVQKESEVLFWRHEAEEKKLAAQVRKLPFGDEREALRARLVELSHAHKAERAEKRAFDREAWGW